MNLKVHQHPGNASALQGPVRDCGRGVRPPLKQESQHEMGVKTDFWIVRDEQPGRLRPQNLA
jgi:hypothetical protein